MNSVVLDSGNPKEQNTKANLVQSCRHKLSKQSDTSDTDCAVICLKKIEEKRGGFPTICRGRELEKKRGANDAGKMIFDQNYPVVVLFGCVTVFWKARMHTEVFMGFTKSSPLFKRL